MLEAQQVLAIANNDDRKFKFDKSAQKRAADIYYGMSLHTLGAAPSFRDYSKPNNPIVTPPNYISHEYQKIFDTYLINRHPRESEVTRQWRYSQYRPFTKGAFIRVIELISGGIFQDANWDIDIPNERDRAFIYGNNFEGYDLAGFFNRAIKNIVEDANGYFVRMPKKHRLELEPNEDIMPEIWFVNSKEIRFIDKDDFIFQREQYLYWINKTDINRLDKTDKGKWILTTASGYYSHQFGYLPIDIAGGVWNTGGYYDSWIDKAKAVADEYVSIKSAEQLINKEAAHPYIVMAANDCPTCHGVGTTQYECEDCPNGIDIRTCPTCKGHKTISFNPSDRMEVPIEDMDKDYVKIINHDVDANKHYKDLTDQLYEQILEELNLT